MTRPAARPLSGGRPSSSLLRRLPDWTAFGVTLGSGLLVLALTAALVVQLCAGSSLARHQFGWGFLRSSNWDPVNDEYGAVPFIYGTVVTTAVALAMAVPVGLGCAVFLSELAPRRLSDALTFLIELLVAVPSVIYGLLAIFVLVPVLTHVGVPPLQRALGWTPFFAGPFYGVSLLSASLVLAIMVVPFIVSVSREVLLAVPVEQREGALSLGATRWETTWKVVVPYARTGIFGSVFLAMARALGETMAVTMVIGNTPDVHRSLLAPGYTIAAVIANEFTEASGDLYVQSLVELGLVLFGLTVVINAVARLLVLATGSGGRR